MPNNVIFVLMFIYSYLLFSHELTSDLVGNGLGDKLPPINQFYLSFVIINCILFLSLIIMTYYNDISNQSGEL